MSDLLIIEFSSEKKAEGVREILLTMEKEYLIELGDAVIAIRNATGHIKLNQLLPATGQSRTSDVNWRALIEVLMTVSATAAATDSVTAGGPEARPTNLGIDDEFVKQAARILRSGNAALLLLIRNMTTDKVLAELHSAGGTALRSPFDETKEKALQTAFTGAQAASTAACD